MEIIPFTVATVPADSQNADHAEQIEEATAHRKMQVCQMVVTWGHEHREFII